MDYEHDIDAILRLHHTRGRKHKIRQVWDVQRHDPEHNVTIALISMCIKDDMNQTFEQLIERVSQTKERPYGECLAVLSELRNKGELGFYDDMTKDWTKWTPGEE